MNENSALITAVYQDNPTEVRALIEQGLDPNSADQNGMTALHCAAGRGQTAVCELLLDCGAKVDARDNNGQTPLHLAARFGHCDVLSLLIQRGADVLAQERWEKQTALHLAAIEGWPDAVGVLLEAGARPDDRDIKRRTPLWQAAWYGRADVLGVLFGSGVDIDAADRNGVTPLLAALMGGHGTVARGLLAMGAEGNVRETTQGLTPLHVAAANGDRDLVEMLLNAGADPSVASYAGESPAAAAMNAGHMEICVLLGGVPEKAGSAEVVGSDFAQNFAVIAESEEDEVSLEIERVGGDEDGVPLEIERVGGDEDGVSLEIERVGGDEDGVPLEIERVGGDGGGDGFYAGEGAHLYEKESEHGSEHAVREVAEDLDSFMPSSKGGAVEQLLEEDTVPIAKPQELVEKRDELHMAAGGSTGAAALTVTAAVPAAEGSAVAAVPKAAPRMRLKIPSVPAHLLRRFAALVVVAAIGGVAMAYRDAWLPAARGALSSARSGAEIVVGKASTAIGSVRTAISFLRKDGPPVDLNAPVTLPEVPVLTGMVNDFARALDQQTARRLEESVKVLHKETGVIFAIVTVRSTGIMPLRDFSELLASKWKPVGGSRQQGTLFTAAINDGKAHVWSGKSVHGALWKLSVEDILAREVEPRFAAQNFAGGVAHGAQAIIDLMRREYKFLLSSSPRSRRPPPPRTEADEELITLTLVSDPPGAYVKIDDKDREARTPCALVLEPGEYRIELVKPGYQPVTRVVRLASEPVRENVVLSR